MKKLLLTCALGILMSAPVQAAPQKSECAYSPLQTLVRDARDAYIRILYVKIIQVSSESRTWSPTLWLRSLLLMVPS